MFASKKYPHEGSVYDVQPVAPGSFAGSSLARRAMAPIGFARNVAQGACAGLLSLLGAMHLTNGVELESDGLAALTAVDGAAWDLVTERALGGGLPGVVEIIGAAAIFLNAGEGWGRILGLLGFVAGALAYANGMDAADFAERAGDLYEFAKSNAHRAPLARP